MTVFTALLFAAIAFGVGGAALSDAATLKAPARTRLRTAGVGATLVLASVLVLLQMLT